MSNISALARSILFLIDTNPKAVLPLSDREKSSYVESMCNIVSKLMTCSESDWGYRFFDSSKSTTGIINRCNLVRYDESALSNFSQAMKEHLELRTTPFSTTNQKGFERSRMQRLCKAMFHTMDDFGLSSNFGLGSSEHRQLIVLVTPAPHTLQELYKSLQSEEDYYNNLDVEISLNDMEFICRERLKSPIQSVGKKFSSSHVAWLWIDTRDVFQHNECMFGSFDHISSSQLQDDDLGLLFLQDAVASVYGKIFTLQNFIAMLQALRSTEITTHLLSYTNLSVFFGSQRHVLKESQRARNCPPPFWYGPIAVRTSGSPVILYPSAAIKYTNPPAAIDYSGYLPNTNSSTNCLLLRDVVSVKHLHPKWLSGAFPTFFVETACASSAFLFTRIVHNLHLTSLHVTAGYSLFQRLMTHLIHEQLLLITELPIVPERLVAHQFVEKPLSITVVTAMMLPVTDTIALMVLLGDKPMEELFDKKDDSSQTQLTQILRNYAALDLAHDISPSLDVVGFVHNEPAELGVDLLTTIQELESATQRLVQHATNLQAQALLEPVYDSEEWSAASSSPEPTRELDPEDLAHLIREMIKSKNKLGDLRVIDTLRRIPTHKLSEFASFIKSALLVPVEELKRRYDPSNPDYSVDKLIVDIKIQIALRLELLSTCNCSEYIRQPESGDNDALVPEASTQVIKELGALMDMIAFPMDVVEESGFGNYLVETLLPAYIDYIPLTLARLHKHMERLPLPKQLRERIKKIKSERPRSQKSASKSKPPALAPSDPNKNLAGIVSNMVGLFRSLTPTSTCSEQRTVEQPPTNQLQTNSDQAVTVQNPAPSAPLSKKQLLLSAVKTQLQKRLEHVSQQNGAAIPVSSGLGGRSPIDLTRLTEVTFSRKPRPPDSTPTPSLLRKRKHPDSENNEDVQSPKAKIRKLVNQLATDGHHR